MSTPAANRRNIRTKKSLRREAIAKHAVEGLLQQHGFKLTGESRAVQNRYLIDVRDLAGRQRTLWFKLGWNPGRSGTSAVQIEMMKARKGRTPTQFTDAEVLREVTEKIRRATDRGVTDLLLFSLDAKNKRPIACLIVPIGDVRVAFQECLRANARGSRKGASPIFWLKGKNPAQIELQRRVERYATENLVDPNFRAEKHQVDDAINDFIPDSSLLGNISPERRIGQVSRFARDPRVREKAIARANGRCELCNQQGFLMPDGQRYLESHHIQALGEEGPDTEDNVIALCANDHRAAHFSADREALAIQMRKVIAAKVSRHPDR